MQEKSDGYSVLSFFEERQNAEFWSRNLMIDLDNVSIDNIKNSQYSAIYNHEYLINDKQDAGNNFTRAHYKLGPLIMDKFNDRLRKITDSCDNPQGFVINQTVGGGTGSGLGSLILERITVDYRKKTKMGFHIYPSLICRHSNCVVDSGYNALFATHWLLDHTEVSVIFDNQKLHKLCQQHLKIDLLSFKDMNLLISKVISDMTISLRFEGEFNMDLNEFQTNSFQVFPRLHFLLSSLSPIVIDETTKKIRIQPQYSKILVDGFIGHYYPFHNDLYTQQITE